MPEDFRTFYRQNGFCVFPLARGGKKPTGKWMKYMEGTAEKPDPVDMKDGTNYAVVCGPPSNGLVILDFERMDDAEAFARSFSTDLLQHTFCVMSPHGGVHLYFRSLKPAGRKIRVFGDEHPVDILGEHGYALIPPAVVDHTKCDEEKEGCPHKGTSAYESIGTLAVMESDDVCEVLFRKGKELGWTLKEEARKQHGEGKTQDIAPPVFLTDEQIDAAVGLLQPVYRPGFRDLVCMYLSGYLRLAGVQQSQSENIVEALAKSDPMHGDVGKAVRTVDDTYRKTGTISGYMGLENTLRKMHDVDADEVLDALEGIIAAGHRIEKGKTEGDTAVADGFHGCDRKHDAVKFVQSTFVETPDAIIEQVNGGYVVWSKKDDTWKIVPHYHTGEFVVEKAKRKGKKQQGDEEVKLEVVHTPLRTLSLESGQLVLADEPEPCVSLSALIAEIEEKAVKWLFIGEEEQTVFKVQLRVAVASWFLGVFRDPKIQERIAGLASDVGVSGGGKKRFLTIMKMIAYRPFYTLNTGKIPSIFRLLEPWGMPTLLVDEADQKETGSEAEWIQFINARYDGTPIPRYNAATQKMEIFRSFGFTVMALRRMPKDEGTTSRMVKINATISPVELPEIAGRDIYEEFRSVRNRLLWLRLKHYGKLEFVGSSGLGVDQSWRGKETLTLYRLMAQIDPAVDKDIVEISKVLTAREVENLSSTIDGLIINEIYSFITDDDATYVKRGVGVYIVQKREDKEGNVYTTPLTLKKIAEPVGIFATEVERSLRQFKIGVYQRFRIGSGGKGKGTHWRGILQFSHLNDTDRIFQRYIPDYNHILTKISEAKNAGNLDDFKPVPGKDTKDTMTKIVDPGSVPGVPGVPPNSKGGDLEFGLDSEKRKKEYSTNIQYDSTDVQEAKNTPDTHIPGTPGTPGTDGTEQSENLVEKVLLWIVEKLAEKRGAEMEQTEGYLLMAISEEMKDENISLYTVKDACREGSKRGLLRERNGKWNAVVKG